MKFLVLIFFIFSCQDNKSTIISNEVLGHATSVVLKNCLSSKCDSGQLIKDEMALLENQINLKTAYSEKLTGSEMHSLKHQQELISLMKNYLLADDKKTVDINQDVFIKGVLDSDKGKLSAYQKLWDEQSDKGTLLLLVMQGKGPKRSTSAIEEILRQMGFKSKVFINASTKHAEIRKVFSKHMALKNYFHEHIALVDNVIALEENLITASEFKKYLMANLFHNGPGVGFWKTFQEQMLPKLIGQEDFKLIFNNTIYTEKEKKIINYGRPYGIEGFLAAITDRLSQGTARGVLKIAYEIQNYSNAVQIVDRLLLSQNPNGTISQLNELNKISQAADELSVDEKYFLKSIIFKAKQRLLKFVGYNRDRIRVENNQIILNITANPIIINKETHFSDLILILNNLLEAEEKLNGSFVHLK